MDQVLDHEAQTDEKKGFICFADRHGESSAQTSFQQAAVKVQRIASVLNG